MKWYISSYSPDLVFYYPSFIVLCYLFHWKNVGRNGSNARGYFTWSFLDVLELLDGFRSSYGLYYVDLDDPDLERYPKLSAYWYSGFLKGRNITPDGAIDIKKNKIALSSDQYIQ